MLFDEAFRKKLEDLSEILVKEKNHLLRSHVDFTDDLMFRSAEIWRAYFSEGIMLSSGGVETSLFGLKEVQDYSYLQSFNEYPGSMNAYSSLTQELCKSFLLEEGMISSSNDCEKVVVACALGSHEGLMRAARLMYKKGINEGCFFPEGSYGLIASAFRDLKPYAYKIHLVESKRNNGEKISLSHLQSLLKQNLPSKLLFIDQKTTAGAVYTEQEIIDIIKFCKENQLILIADAAHIHMEFSASYKFPAVASLCQSLAYHDYIVLFTGSKTYGLERARVGLILFDSRNSLLTLQDMENQFVRMFGTFSELSIAATHCLMNFPIEKKVAYLRSNIFKHRYNMNLMIAYIEGIDSKKIDNDLRNVVRSNLPSEWQVGIKGLYVIYKPESGVHLKIDVSQFNLKFFLNIQIFNSEILCYVLNKMYGIVTLHAFQIMDPSGYGMRLGFSSEKDVHAGMKAMHEFFDSLTDSPISNPYIEMTITPQNLKNRNNAIVLSNNSNAFYFHSKVQPVGNTNKNNSVVLSKL